MTYNNFGDAGFIISLLDPKDLAKALEKAKTFKPKMYKSNTENFIKKLSNEIDSMWILSKNVAI